MRRVEVEYRVDALHRIVFVALQRAASVRCQVNRCAALRLAGLKRACRAVDDVVEPADFYAGRHVAGGEDDKVIVLERMARRCECIRRGIRRVRDQRRVRCLDARIESVFRRRPVHAAEPDADRPGPAEPERIAEKLLHRHDVVRRAAVDDRFSEVAGDDVPAKCDLEQQILLLLVFEVVNESHSGQYFQVNIQPSSLRLWQTTKRRVSLPLA